MIIEYPVFSDSNLRGNIQLADAIAYTFNYNNSNLKRSHVLLRREIDNLFKVCLSKMIDPLPSYPAYCYKIWPIKKKVEVSGTAAASLQKSL